MRNRGIYLLALTLAWFSIAVFAEPLPESAPEPETEPETSAEPESGASSEPENSALMVQGHILTAFISFLAYVLLK